MRFLEDNGVLYEKEGPVMWRCEGCGFRLDLPEAVAPPMWHTLDRPIDPKPGKYASHKLRGRFEVWSSAAA